MYVKRDGQGKIISCAEEKQDGWVEEWLEVDDPELLAYLNPPVRSNWQGLKASLRGTDLFGKVMETANSNAVALLLDVFQSSDNDSDRWEDFKYALTLARIGLDTDYTEEQLERFRSILASNGFDNTWVT
ncbi:hypothetical protein [Pantanalinema sp. GBBB05]|uniref:hypothetical protein n=1 Tax=Pantanalinema sp. GBBB05 TaxID=2604139 RepID=UPI001DB038C1|nr:hypothetical protein [Pantanalinema sp. GBBB05]